MTAKRKSTARSRVSNGTQLLPGIDGRSAEARRFRDLCEAFTADIGGGVLSAAQAALVRQAAGVTLRAELQQAAIVRGEDVDMDELTRLTNVIARLMSALGVKARPAPSAPDLASYIAGKTGRAA